MSVSNVLVIGASRGIGLQIVAEYLTKYPSAKIYATARDVSKATELAKLASSSNGRVTIVSLIADDMKSNEAAADEIKKTTGALDHVIYNAGVLGGWGNLLEIGIEGLKTNMETNVYGAYYAAVVFSPFLLASTYSKKSLVLMSSTFGSLALATEQFKTHEVLFGSTGADPCAQYNISKTALNRLGKELDGVLNPKGVPVILVHPGLVKTDMNPVGNIDVIESANGVFKAIDAFSPSEKNFVSYTGEAIPW
ncbi:NAD(P)-binding protein [Tothia fuscella]|uniref:NAD(P)-binding protein n=1 Tax=Tothia fuscella TaxID=1048955 RepID=A0A9P4NDN6_9PEZI|nr:NAD(P)-binding protein [Tothia fuscella]